MSASEQAQSSFGATSGQERKELGKGAGKDLRSSKRGRSTEAQSLPKCDLSSFGLIIDKNHAYLTVYSQPDVFQEEANCEFCLWFRVIKSLCKVSES
ncbi:hypothetical protein NliqN6_5168 [Naganishia liquefaciens]|uniref:Uncharacterized protein n=1 Tax=Naganishia liquefaciens TaxID=104408 RepID=A0A8H3YIP0_9TREE|nr:hypothetical protein NliqN6_5168 [Naganishia liquefaciens]